MAAEKCHRVGRRGRLSCQQPPSHPAVGGVCAGAAPAAPRPEGLEHGHKCHNAVRAQPVPARRRLVPALGSR